MTLLLEKISQNEFSRKYLFDKKDEFLKVIIKIDFNRREMEVLKLANSHLLLYPQSQ